MICIAAVSCSTDAYRLPAMGFGIWLTGKMGYEWVGAWVGAWLGAWVVHDIVPGIWGT